MTFIEWIADVDPAPRDQPAAYLDDARGLGRMLRDLHDALRPVEGELGGLRQPREDIERLLGRLRSADAHTETSRSATCFARRGASSGTTSRTCFEARSTGMWPAMSALSGSTAQATAPCGRCSTLMAGTMSRNWPPFLAAQDVYGEIWRMYDRQRRRLSRPAG